MSAQQVPKIQNMQREREREIVLKASARQPRVCQFTVDDALTLAKIQYLTQCTCNQFH
uniref:Uncharacterized protein n=1 Tax=Anguilla anguilla TaxID=7936 RepID=A0A0E9TGC5_ANGAN